MPLLAIAPPQFETRDPDVLLAGGLLSIRMPVLNSGGSTALKMTLTGVTVGAAVRTEPALPFVLGDLAPDNRKTIGVVFVATGIAAGSRVVLTARGTYLNGSQLLGFTLNRVITVPAEVPPPTTFLAAHLQTTVNLSGHTWSFAIVNDEPAGSPRYVDSVSLDMVAPFTVTGTPDGWAVDTDNATYVFWYATDLALPYPHHVAPGATLNGFQVQASASTSSEGRPYSMTSWNHTTDATDLVTFGTSLVPSHS